MRTKIIILGLIYLLMLGSVFAVEKKDVLNHNWQSLFTEPIETLYIIMKDKIGFKYTSHDEVMVHMNIGMLEKWLKKKNYEIKDIAIIIHNHLKNCRFSPDDWKQYRDFKSRGFTGQFLLYCQMTNKIYDIENKIK